MADLTRFGFRATLVTRMADPIECYHVCVLLHRQIIIEGSYPRSICNALRIPWIGLVMLVYVHGLGQLLNNRRRKDNCKHGSSTNRVAAGDRVMRSIQTEYNGCLW
jgi:hypothetical protein